MNNIFLGNPPENIKQWIINDYNRKQEEKLKIPLCFTAEQDGSSVSLVCQNQEVSDPTPPNLQYSLNDTEHWTEYEINQIIPLAKDAKVFFKANGQNERISAPPTMGPTMGLPQIYQFVMKGKIAASGNIQYLLDETGSRADVPIWCYNSMFGDCTSLTQAPALPATTLASDCYHYMFANCSSLTQAPALPATTLAQSCYENMFVNCTSLTQAPAIKTYTPGLHAFDSMLYTVNSDCNWPDLTLSEAESMVLGEYIFGYDDSGSGVRISITCKDGSGTAYYDSSKYSWVFEY